MTYILDDVNYEDMDDLVLSEHIEWDSIESSENRPNDISMDALDIYDSHYG